MSTTTTTPMALAEWAATPLLAALEFANAMGAAPLNAQPGVWEGDIDERWHVALNGHLDPLPDRSGVPLAPFTARVSFNGWPAGEVDASDGWFAAGDAANASTFADAVFVAVRSAKAVAS